jgi:hypothetical protein
MGAVSETPLGTVDYGTVEKRKVKVTNACLDHSPDILRVGHVSLDDNNIHLAS